MGENIHVKLESNQSALTIYTAKELDKREKKPYILEDKHISTPAVYLAKRKPAIEDTVVTYSVRDGYIRVRSASVPGEGETGSLQNSIVGKLVINPDLLELKINDAKAKFNLTDMKNHIKSNKRFFASETEYNDILKNVTEFEASVSASIKAKSDDRGNASSAYEKITKTAFNPFFGIRIPIFDGFDPLPFKVELCYHLHQHGAIDFWFLSDELKDVIDTHGEGIINSELKKIAEMDYLILK